MSAASLILFSAGAGFGAGLLGGRVRAAALRRALPWQHAIRSPYSRHPAARLFRSWRRFAGDDAAADILLMPLAGLTVALLVIGFVPGAGEAIATAYLGPFVP